MAGHNLFSVTPLVTGLRSRRRVHMRPGPFNAIPLVLAVVSLCAGPVLAQSGLASLRGTVRDATGAVIPGATLTLSEPATDTLVRTVVSDDVGSYEMPDLRPGTYRLQVELQGFKTFVSENVLLESGQTRRVDAALDVGDAREEVTVVAGAQVLTTDTGQISGRFNAEEYQKSAFVDVFPSPFAMFSTQPGVQGSGWGVVVAGQPRSQMVEAMDGVHSRAQGQTNNTNFMEEVSVDIVNAPADSSRVTSYNMVSKRGQNEFRGMAYYEHFNSALNAKPFFETEEVPFKLHEWQLELGGPVFRNKTFFYGSWAAQRIPEGSFNLATVPTPQMHDGDFSEVGTPIMDPLTGTPFPNNRIPAERLSSVALAAQENFIPLPNRGGEGALANNFEWVHPFHWDYTKGDWPFVRIDHNLSDSNTLYGRWMTRRTPYVLVTNLPKFFWTRLRDHQRVVLSDTHVFSPAVVNTVRVGYSRDFIEDGEEQHGEVAINGADAVATLGLQGVNPDGFSAAGFPAMDITGFSNLSTVTGGIKSDNDELTFEQSLTWTTGRHVWNFGVQYLTYEDFEGVVPNYGSFTFNGEITGHPYADFLLGIPFESSRVPHPLVNRRQTSKEIGLYVRDSFKVNANLTLDYGLRWDYFPAARYEDGLMYNWDKATGAVIVPSDALDAVSALYPDTIEVRGGDVIAEPETGNLRPRASVAYRINERTVIRGGYGAFTERIGEFRGAQGGGPFEIDETFQNVIQPGDAPLFAFPNPFPGLAFASVPSQSVSSYPLQTDNGTIHQFNVSVERELVSRVGLRLSYIGSRSVGLNYSLNINKPEPSTTPFTTDRRPSPQFVNIDEVRSDGSARYDAFQVQVQKRGGPFTFNAHYTWARDQADYLNEENPNDVTGHWANAAATRRHYAMVNTSWELPFGRGRRILSDASPLVDRLVGGWAISTVSYFGSGTFFTPSFSGSDPSNTGTFGGIPDRIGSGNLPADQREPTRWFNPDDFAVPPNGRFGNAGVNILEGDGLHVHHVSLAKETRFAGDMSLTFALTASNIFDQVHFSNPASNISTATVGTISGVMSDFQPERAGRRMVTLKGIVRF
ncbi:MAG: hypothetical protein GEU99_16155 [Luteitalea sp.]|nr:hypothetical protein [Luteitalea sp.]